MSVTAELGSWIWAARCACATIVILTFAPSCQHVDRSPFMRRVDLPEGRAIRQVWMSSSGDGVACWLIGYPDRLVLLGGSPDHAQRFLSEIGFPASVQVSGDLSAAACLGTTVSLIDLSTGTVSLGDKAVASDSILGHLLALSAGRGWVAYQSSTAPYDRRNVSHYGAEDFRLIRRLESVDGYIDHCVIDDKSENLVIVSGGSVYVMSLDGSPLRMVLRLEDSGVADLVAGGGFAILGTRDGEIVAIDLAAGQELWREEIADGRPLTLGMSASGRTLGVAWASTENRGVNVSLSLWSVGVEGTSRLGMRTVRCGAMFERVCVSDQGHVLVVEQPHLYSVDLILLGSSQAGAGSRRDDLHLRTAARAQEIELEHIEEEPGGLGVTEADRQPPDGR